MHISFRELVAIKNNILFISKLPIYNLPEQVTDTEISEFCTFTLLSERKQETRKV
jgi:hypothetical protein